MIIAVTGLTGSGKDTLGRLVAKKLKYRLVSPTFKDLAKKEGVSLMEFQKMAEKDPDIDRKFDDFLRGETLKGDCVVTTWLGPWMVEADVRIKIFAPAKVRAERIAKRDGMPYAGAIRHVNERDDNNRRRYKKLYKIDIDNDDIFDACINSGVYTPEKLLKIAMEVIKQKSG